MSEITVSTLGVDGKPLTLYVRPGEGVLMFGSVAEPEPSFISINDAQGRVRTWNRRMATEVLRKLHEMWPGGVDEAIGCADTKDEQLRRVLEILEDREADLKDHRDTIDEQRLYAESLRKSVEARGREIVDLTTVVNCLHGQINTLVKERDEHARQAGALKRELEDSRKPRPTEPETVYYFDFATGRTCNPPAPQAVLSAWNNRRDLPVTEDELLALRCLAPKAGARLTYCFGVAGGFHIKRSSDDAAWAYRQIANMRGEQFL